MQVIKDQFSTMLNNGIIPCFEYELYNGDYLVVHLQIDDKGIIFEFDQDNKEVFFDGEIVNEGDTYLLPFDECFEDLDHYVQMIDQNINEGFIIPNNLFKSE